MTTPRILLLKLALRACEHGDAEGGAEALRGLIAMTDHDAPTTAATEVRAVSRPEFARMIGVTCEHVSHLIKRGEIPGDAVLGRGRGTRIVVDAAIAALKHRKSSSRDTEAGTGDAVQDEGAAYVRRRSALRVVRGNGGRS